VQGKYVLQIESSTNSAKIVMVSKRLSNDEDIKDEDIKE